MSKTTCSTSGCCPCTLFRAAILGFILIGVFAAVAHFYTPEDKDILADQAAARKAYREQLEAEQKQAATTYAWIDKEAGIVRLPVARAKELMIEEAK